MSATSTTSSSPAESVLKMGHILPSSIRSPSVPPEDVVIIDTNPLRSTEGGFMRRLSLPALPGRRITLDPKKRSLTPSIGSLLPSASRIRLPRWGKPQDKASHGEVQPGSGVSLSGIAPSMTEKLSTTPPSEKIYALTKDKPTLHITTPHTSLDSAYFPNSPTVSSPLNILPEHDLTQTSRMPASTNPTHQHVWLCTPPPRSPISPLSSPQVPVPRTFPARPRFTTRSISTGRLATEFDADGRVICLSVHSERIFSCPKKSIMPGVGGLVRSQSALEADELGMRRRGVSEDLKRGGGRGSLERLVEGGDEGEGEGVGVHGEKGLLGGIPLRRRETEGMGGRGKGGSWSPAERMKSWIGGPGVNRF